MTDNQRRILKTGAGAMLVLVLAATAVSATARARARSNGIEVEGYPTAISTERFTFTIERATDVDVEHGAKPKPPFRIVTTARTKFETADDTAVSRQAFFRALKSTDEVEVKGYLNGDTITAYKIEIED